MRLIRNARLLYRVKGWRAAARYLAAVTIINLGRI